MLKHILILASLVISTTIFPAQPVKKVNFITHGPVLGRLDSDGIGIWARTAYEGTFAVRYGRSANQLDNTSKPTVTRIEHDNTGWIHISGLDANTKYYYQLFLPGIQEHTGRRGSFTTLPNDQMYREPELNPKGLFNFSFEFACGNNQNPGHSAGPSLPAFSTMLARLKDKIHFAILNGDWLYETQRNYSPHSWLSQVGLNKQNRPDILKHAPTLAGVWQNYKHFYNQSTNLSKWHREIPSFFTFDDHEILNDVWGAGTPGLRDRRATFRDIGVRAWYDYLGWSNPNNHTQPIHFGTAKLESGSDVLYDRNSDFTALNLEHMTNLHVHWGTETAGVNNNALDGVGGDPNAGVYEIRQVIDAQHLKIFPPADGDTESSYSIGRKSYFTKKIGNCEFFFLDTRGQRQMHDINEPDKPGLSMLGLEQRQWLMEGIRKSDADFIFVISSVNFMIPHVGGGKVRASNKDDAWTVFLDEREKLIEFWDALNQKVFVLTGDLHNSFAIKITDNVWEFASGPHNSNNHWYTDEGLRPANGPFQYDGRKVDIRWSTHFRDDIPRSSLLHPTFCVVQVNNVYNNPIEVDGERWVAFPIPQVIFQYYNGRTGRLLYAESVLAQD